MKLKGNNKTCFYILKIFKNHYKNFDNSMRPQVII